jgi:hypothetical protein
LISAIAACADGRFQKKAYWFLQGLSNDELQYIAEFLGACVLESCRHEPSKPGQLADDIALFDRSRLAPSRSLDDPDHKMIVLREYLCRCNLMGYSLALRAGHLS